MMLKQELTGKTYSLQNRLRLFQSTVGATLLYGAEAWALTRQMEKKVLRLQRRMLRMILGHGRRKLGPDDDELEPWVDWLKRTTREAEKKLKEIGVETWTVTYRRRKWKWASHVANMSAGRPAYATAAWNAEFTSEKGRQVGHPSTRWSDSITHILELHNISVSWLEAAQDTNLWASLEEAYVEDSVR